MSHNQPYLPEDDLLWRQLKTIPAFRAVLRAVESRFYFAVDLPGPTLDVGCGDGHFAQMTFDRPLDVGLDPWWNPLKKAYRSDAYNLVLQGMGDRMPFPDNHFASAFSNSVLEHIPDIQPVLNETSRVLQENGRFLITMPSQYFTQELGGALWLEKLSLDGMAGRYRRFFNRISRHEHTDSPEVWAARLAQAGFVVERWQYYFSAKALHALEVGHAQGLPAALMHFLTGTWIVAPWNSSLAWTERWLRPFYQEEAAADRGAYLLIVSRKQTNGPTPVHLPPARPFTVAELETAVAAKTPILHEPVLPDLAPVEVLPEAVVETAVSPPAEIQPAPQRQPRFDLIAASLLGLTLLLALIGQMSVSQPAAALSSGLRWFLLSFLAFFLLAWRVKAVKIRMPAWKRPSFRPETIPKRRWFYLLAFFLTFIAYRLAVSPAPWPAWLTLALWLGSIGLAFYALHVSETRSEPVEDRWFGQAQPTPPRLFEKIPKGAAPAPEQTAVSRPEMATWLLAAAGIILFAAALAVRAAGLGSHPWILNGLESSLGLDVLAITRGLSTNPFGVGWLTNPTLPLFLTPVPVNLLGPSMVSLRVLSPVVDALTV
ncbi:MAG: class I SAM-dependent methyltransferase [Chloroflexota bacterium]